MIRIRVKFVVNRFGWDPARDEPPIESVSTVRDIMPEALPSIGDLVELGLPDWKRIFVRSRTTLALSKSSGAIDWIVEMKCDDKAILAMLRENGWK